MISLSQEVGPDWEWKEWQESCVSTEERASQFRAAFSQRFPIFLPFPKSPINIFINHEVLAAPMLGRKSWSCSSAELGPLFEKFMEVQLSLC